MHDEIKRMFKKDFEAKLEERDYIVTHNGMDVKLLQSNREVLKMMVSSIEDNMHLHPKKIFDRTIKNGTDEGVTRWLRIVRIKYITLYEEDFFIEF